MAEMKKVTYNQFLEKLNENKDKEHTLQLPGWQVPILHGLIALAADHPGIKNLHSTTHQTIEELRGWCKKVFTEWGFSPEEVEYIDKMREQAAAKSKEGG